ncbi:pentatricopeptide repeat-containing protein At3g03580 [Punica granatum]|uniref:DYW domain-containing protein n=2 Tax=Punica granatum TaxID=22663 RepID=A0A218VUT4_PUNGR|nr:pentatricopeptide repeat-containing protein At3g03580 [Punica granatum]OWM64314.1 hypothetical protein CDL15_Pgr014104 [Punica granatum]PKI57912.1 hypothetical protein CRG98_021700 [Punica granatum]
MSVFPTARARETLRSSVSAALSSASTPAGLRRVHALIITAGLYRSEFFAGKLISKYAHFRDPKSSLSVFRRASPTNNVYQWNSIVRAFTHNGFFLRALHFYTEMRRAGVLPDTYTFPSVINACAGSLDVETGRVVHGQVLELGFGSDLYIGNAVIDMYARFTDLHNAHAVFDKMSERDVVSWNSLISGYSSNGYFEEAMYVYRGMRKEGILIDLYTVSSVLPACGGLVALEDGWALHGLVAKSGMGSDTIVSNGLLSMYFKFNDIRGAQKIFSDIVFKDSVSWNTMICGYCQLELFEESIKLFMEMIETFTPDILTITSVLRACGHLQDCELGKFVNNYMVEKGLELDTRANNILLDMHIKSGNFTAAMKVFNEMDCKDHVSWNSMISGCVQYGHQDEAVRLFRMMKLGMKPDSVTHLILLSVSSHFSDLFLGKQVHCETVKSGHVSELCLSNGLIDMYAKCKEIDDSLKLFESMSIRDVVTWNTVISTCVHHEDCELGFILLGRMRNDGVSPDKATFLGVLPICSLLAAKRHGKEIHGCIFRLGFESEVSIGNALIDMYSKCGNIGYTIKIFELLKGRDVVTWTTLITAYGMYGEGKKAIKAFTDMEECGILPDPVAFIAVLYACSHSGLVEEGLQFFHYMKSQYNFEPQIEHYASVVDLLARSGCLVEAENFIHSMPLKPDVSIWGALLSACRANSGIGLAERISKRIIELDSENTGYHVLVSNVYAALGKWDQVKMVRKSIKSRELRKDPGSSWMEIRRKLYIFRTGDQCFEQSEEVYELLETLGDSMVKQGYVPDLQCVLHDVGDDEKREMLQGHSERLAIAFGLLNTARGSPLQIMKNLRVCPDCHAVTKYISNITQREILVRDANRFHLFRNGTCSCGDLW